MYIILLSQGPLDTSLIAELAMLIKFLTYYYHPHVTYLKRGLSVVTIPTSNSDGLKSADNTDDRQLMAV